MSGVGKGKERGGLCLVFFDRLLVKLSGAVKTQCTLQSLVLRIVISNHLCYGFHGSAKTILPPLPWQD